MEPELPQVDWLEPLLIEYNNLFLTHASLPLVRLTDHHIPLFEGANPVNVRPYRYRHFQKQEFEKQSRR